jgi:hypothetical protein
VPVRRPCPGEVDVVARRAEPLRALADELRAATAVLCRRAAKALTGFRQGRAGLVVDPVDRAVVRLPRRIIRRLDGWALRHLTGA